MTRRLLVSVAAVVLCSACGDAEIRGPDVSVGVAAATHVLAEASLGPVRATVRTDVTEPRFGDRFQMVLEIVHDPRVRLEPIEFTDRIGHFRRVGRKDPPRTRGGPVVYGLHVEPERTGTNIGKLPPIVFEVVRGEGAGTVQALRIPAFEMDVAGLAPDQRPTLADVGDPLPPLPLPPRERGQLTLWVALAGGAVLLVLTGLVWRQRRRRADWMPPPLDPLVEARRALEVLMGKGLVEKGAFAAFYVELTGIVRLFIERTTGVDAPDRTTEEFLREVEGHEAFPVQKRQALGRFLEAADLVKYAAQVPGSNDVDEAVDAAYVFCGLNSEQAEACAPSI
ncbi:MAG: hypothetical protein HRU14_00620 [Planctomycetes bacterium]|nr:hypothetical protein [Planctomycetota bacterium]